MKGAIAWVWVRLSHRRRRTSRLTLGDYEDLFKSLCFGVLVPIAIVATLVTGQARGWDLLLLLPMSLVGVTTSWFIVTEPKDTEVTEPVHQLNENHQAGEDSATLPHNMDSDW